MKSVKLLAVVAIAVAAIVVCAAIVMQPSKNPERIGVIGAMPEEVETLKAAMSVEHTEEISGMEFYVGTLDDCDVVVVQCGIGKVNAGVCAQLLINKFNVKAIINTGAAGSLDNRLDIEDFVVSTDAVQHDYDVSPIGYEKGEIPYTGKFAFEADKELRALAVKAIKEKASDVNYLEGRVCSGDQFISSQAQKDTILANFGGLCCDMEGGAIAHVCYLNDTPFVIIRAISDKADGSAPEDYTEFEENAAKRSAKVVEYLLWELM